MKVRASGWVILKEGKKDLACLINRHALCNEECNKYRSCRRRKRAHCLRCDTIFGWARLDTFRSSKWKKAAIGNSLESS